MRVGLEFFIFHNIAVWGSCEAEVVSDFEVVDDGGVVAEVVNIKFVENAVEFAYFFVFAFEDADEACVAFFL